MRSSAACFFVRSAEEQAHGESPEHHEHRAGAYAQSKGWNVSEVYDLSGVSEKSVMEHPEAICEVIMLFNLAAEFLRSRRHSAHWSPCTKAPPTSTRRAKSVAQESTVYLRLLFGSRTLGRISPTYGRATPRM